MLKLSSQRKAVFKKFYPFIKDDIKLYFELSGLKLWMLILSLITPVLYLMLINGVMVDRNMSTLVYVIAGYIAVYLLQTIGTVVNKVFYNKLFLKFRLRIKANILSKFTKMNAVIYSRYETGDLKSRLDSDIGIIEKFFVSHVLDYLYSIASAIVIAAIMVIMNPILALTGLVMVPVSFWFVKFMGKKVKKANEEQRKIFGEYESFLHNTFQNWKEIKANNLEKNRDEVLQTYREKLSELFMKNHVYWYINRSFIAFKDFFITKMNLYFIGGLLIIAGQMDVGILLAFMNYYAQFFNNISQITELTLGMKNDSPSINRVLEIINIPFDGKPNVKHLPDILTVKNLSFKYYEEQELVLNNINLAIPPKEHVAVVGRSGSGKTTLARLLMGLYEPQNGEVFIGDYNISSISFESIGRKVGIVLQEPPLFNLTIRENLRFARKRVTEDELVNACKKANIFDFINSLPDKFDTVIGERGIKLSGGQKQRLSIARAILQDPDIIIFDEATSSLDSENERAIVSAINNLSKGKTVITIAHRLSTVAGCDRVVVMDNGKIAAVGKHEELRGNNEIYDLLFENQYNVG